MERRRAGGGAVAAEAARPRAGDGRDDPGRGIDLADAVVFSVRNVEVAGAVQRNPCGEVEPRRGGRAAVAAEAGHPRPGDGRDVSGSGIDPADAVVEQVRNVEVAAAVQSKPRGAVERRRGGRAAIAAEAEGPRAGDGRDVPGRGIDLADAVLEVVRDVEVAGAVQRKPAGVSKPRRGGRAAIAAEASRPRSGDGRNVAGRGIDLADTVVVRVRNVEVAGAVQRNPCGEVEPRRGGRAAIAAEAGRP